MTKDEAIVLLAACHQLAYRLGGQGVDTPLTDGERGVLAGFIRVWQAAMLDDPDIHSQAGLDSDDMANLSRRKELTCKIARLRGLNLCLKWKQINSLQALSYMAAQVQAEEMQRHHGVGEQLD